MDMPNPVAGDALLVADIQNDFLPGGALAVPKSDEVLAPLNVYIEAFRRQGLPIFASRDWHPPGHCSFRAQGGPWPEHCVAGSKGARFSAALNLPAGTAIVSKATRRDVEAYSAFAGTELDALLREAGVKRLYIGGLTTEYCVLNTVRDAVRLGYQVVLLRDAVRAVDVAPGDGARAEAEMIRLGAQPIDLRQTAPA